MGKMAQFWSSKCQFKHGNPVFEASALGFNRVGTNIWGSEGPFDVTAVVKQWNDQIANFSVTTQNCLPDTVCGSYKQVSSRVTIDLHFAQIVDVNRIQGIKYSPQGSVLIKSEARNAAH